jgi:hypothetical protein
LFVRAYAEVVHGNNDPAEDFLGNEEEAELPDDDVPGVESRHAEPTDDTALSLNNFFQGWILFISFSLKKF